MQKKIRVCTEPIYFFLILLAFFISSFSTTAFALDYCSGGNSTLSSQAAVDNFQTDFGPCDAFSGQLTITGADITNLDGLAALISVFHLTVVDNPALTSIGGLSSVTAVAFDLTIRNNSVLTNVNGLSALTSTSGWITISDNPLLSNVDGLLNLERVDVGITLSGNSALANLDGLSALISTGYFSIVNNTALNNCIGLSPLVDSVDDGDPGPGTDPIPDVGWGLDGVSLSGNLPECNFIDAILGKIQILDFEGVAPEADPWSLGFAPSYHEDGFVLTEDTTLMPWIVYDSHHPTENVNGSDVMFLNTPFNPNFLALESGGPFDMLSIDVADRDSSNGSSSASLVAYFVGGGTLQQDIVLEDTWKTVELVGFTNLEQVDIKHGFPIDLLFDDVVLRKLLPEVKITPDKDLVTTESGDTATFEVVLNTTPAADVSIGLSSSNTNEGVVEPTSLVFTSLDWDTPQTVTITGVDDALEDGHQTYLIVTSATTSADADYDGLNPVDVEVINVDNEIPQSPALIALYNSTDGPNWNDNANWLIGDPCLNGWYGVTCDAENTTVTGLMLSANNLVGTIPAELGSQVDLTQLFLDNNQLSGPIPIELGNLTKLWELKLQYNQLNSLIPSQIGNMSELRYLYLQGNQLSGSIPSELGSLLEMRYLYLNNNQLSGSIPSDLGNLTNLRYLYLEGNQLTGEIPTTVSNLTSLNIGHLKLDWNGLYAPDIGLDSFLDTKAGKDWSITQTVAPTNVSVSDTTEHSVILSWDAIEYTSNNGRYRVLYSIAPGGPYNDGGATTSKLETGLTVNGLLSNSTFYFVVQTETDSHLDNINNVASALSFEVSDNTLTAPPGFFINPISGLITSEPGDSDTFEVVLDTQPSTDVTISLTSSDLSEGTVSDTNLTFSVGNWNVPQTVTVTGVDDLEPDGHKPYTVITGVATSGDIDYDGIDPDDISLTNQDDEDFQKAALVTLFNNTSGPNWTNNTNWLVGDPCADAWFGVTCDPDTNIERILLDSNNLVGTIPAELGNLASLKELSLRNNLLSGSIPVQLGYLLNLEYLYLGDNQLDGSIPAELGNLSNLQWLSLNTNQLSGSIPAALGNLTNLRGLNLFVNQLDGSIPATLGNLANLWRLSLGANQLSGPIPVTLGNLTSLNRLNLYDNLLNGSIPVELGNLVNLEYLRLEDNRLDGAVPVELGNLANLSSMYLNGNQLSGPVPSAIASLSNLSDTFGLDLRWNALYTDDASLDVFLDTKSRSDWSLTQTIAPGLVSVSGVSADSAVFNWAPIEYSTEAGRYLVLSSATQGGPYTSNGATVDKVESGYTVAGLAPGTYYFVVQTETDTHSDNANSVLSEFSEEISFEITGVDGVVINSFDATSSLIEAGESITFSWTTTNATECFAVDGVDGWASEIIELPNGDALLTLNTPGTHTYTLECTDDSNIVSAIQQVTVFNDTNSVKINSFEISPNENDVGQWTNISWDVSNADSCTALNGTSGWQETNILSMAGQTWLMIEMPGCYTFTMECTDGLHTVSASQNLNIIDSDIIFIGDFENPVICIE